MWWRRRAFLSLVPELLRFFSLDPSKRVSRLESTSGTCVILSVCWSCIKNLNYIDDFVSTQVKVFTEPSFMELAVEQFLGKSEADVKVVFCFWTNANHIPLWINHLNFLIMSCSNVAKTLHIYPIDNQISIPYPDEQRLEHFCEHWANLLKATLLHTLEGHFRAILSTLTVEVIKPILGVTYIMKI